MKVTCKSLIFISLISLKFFSFDAIAKVNHYEEALQAYNQQKVDAAFIHIKNALRENNNNLPAKLLLAEILIDKKLYSSAEQSLNDAIEQLKTKSGLNKISILGLRLGANLANQATENRKDINTIINWDPIFNGEVNLASLKTMHTEMLVDQDRFYFKREASECEESELIGFNYSEQLLLDINSIKASHWSQQKSKKQLFIFSNVEQQSNDGNDKDMLEQADTFDTSISWTDTEQIETSIAPQTIISHICKELLK